MISVTSDPGAPPGQRVRTCPNASSRPAKFYDGFSGMTRRMYVTAAHGKASQRTTVREAAGGGSTGGTYRSATSGRFVTTAHGKRSPNTTIENS